MAKAEWNLRADEIAARVVRGRGDTPIYDHLSRRRPRAKGPLGRRSLVVNNEEVTAPVSPEVARVLNEHAENSHHAIAARLAPFGLHPHDIAAPEWRRVVYEDELRAE